MLAGPDGDVAGAAALVRNLAVAALGPITDSSVSDELTCGVAGPARQGRGGRNDLPRALALFWATAPFRALARTIKRLRIWHCPHSGDSCRGPEQCVYITLARPGCPSADLLVWRS